MSQRQRLEVLTTEQLRHEARTAGIDGVSRMRKAELIDRLEDQPTDSDLAPPEPVAQAPSPPGARPLLGGLMQAMGWVGLALSLVLALMSPLLGWQLGRRASLRLAAAADTSRDLAAAIGSSRDSLTAGAESLAGASQALETAETSVSNLEPLLESVGTLLGDELPMTIRTTQTALLSAEQGAAAMDRVLRGLAFFGLEYNPSQPLDESLAQTAESLAPLPTALESVEGDLSRSQADVQLLAADIELLVADLEDLSQELESTAEGLDGYVERLEALADSLDGWASRSPWLGPAAGFLVMLLVLWSAMLQAVLVVIGRGLRVGWVPAV